MTFTWIYDQAVGHWTTYDWKFYVALYGIAACIFTVLWVWIAQDEKHDDDDTTEEPKQ